MRRYQGVLNAAGYSNPDYRLQVASLGTGQLLPPDWRLDNLYMKGGKWVPKGGDDYEASYDFDADGDGVYESTEDRHAYELRFEHLRNSGVIWLRVIPISQTEAQREPRVLARQYVQAIAGIGYEVTTLSGGSRVATQRRYAAEILEEHAGTFAAAPAHAVTLDVANVDQIQVVHDDRVRRVRIILARPPIYYEARSVKKSSSTTTVFPALLVAGYSNLPEDFAEGLPVFEDFLARVTVAGQSGVVLEKSTAAAGNAAPVSAEVDPKPSTEPAAAQPEAQEPSDDTPRGVDAGAVEPSRAAEPGPEASRP